MSFNYLFIAYLQNDLDILYIIRKGSAIGILKTNVQCGIGPQLQIQHLVWILNKYAGYTCDH